MRLFIANHAFAIVATLGAAFGLVGGGHALYEIAQMEQHRQIAQEAK